MRLDLKLTLFYTISLKIKLIQDSGIDRIFLSLFAMRFIQSQPERESVRGLKSDNC